VWSSIWSSWPDIYYCLTVTAFIFCGAPSLTRGRVCILYMLLALASAVLGSESLGTRDHILLSQIWDFPFRRLLRLAGSRWRYSTPPLRVTGNVNVTLRLTGQLISLSVSASSPIWGSWPDIYYCLDSYGLFIVEVLSDETVGNWLQADSRYFATARTTQKTPLIFVTYSCRCYPATSCLPRICLRGNLFIEPLPSNGNPCYNSVASCCTLFSIRWFHSLMCSTSFYKTY
jgi:hypothetical protein